MLLYCTTTGNSFSSRIRAAVVASAFVPVVACAEAPAGVFAVSRGRRSCAPASWRAGGGGVFVLAALSNLANLANRPGFLLAGTFAAFFLSHCSATPPPTPGTARPNWTVVLSAGLWRGGCGEIGGEVAGVRRDR